MTETVLPLRDSGMPKAANMRSVWSRVDKGSLTTVRPAR
jgi:hypothetical protein